MNLLLFSPLFIVSPLCCTRWPSFLLLFPPHWILTGWICCVSLCTTHCGSDTCSSCCSSSLQWQVSSVLTLVSVRVSGRKPTRWWPKNIYIYFNIFKNKFSFVNFDDVLALCLQLWPSLHSRSLPRCTHPGCLRCWGHGRCKNSLNIPGWWCVSEQSCSAVFLQI